MIVVLGATHARSPRRRASPPGSPRRAQASAAHASTVWTQSRPQSTNWPPARRRAARGATWSDGRMTCVAGAPASTRTARSASSPARCACSNPSCATTPAVARATGARVDRCYRRRSAQGSEADDATPGQPDPVRRARTVSRAPARSDPARRVGLPDHRGRADSRAHRACPSRRQRVSRRWPCSSSPTENETFYTPAVGRCRRGGRARWLRRRVDSRDHYGIELYGLEHHGVVHLGAEPDRG